MTDIKTLLQWQEIELEGATTQRSLIELKGKLGASPALRAARETFEAADQRVQRGTKMQKELEFDFESISNRLAASQNRLYGGKVKNPKELQGLEDEVAHLTERGNQLQEDILESLLEVEEADETLKAAQESLREVESDWQAEQHVISQEIEQLSGRLAELQVARAALQPRLSRADMELYADLRRRKGPSPIVYVINGNCEGCGVSLSVSSRRQVQAGDELVFCSSCGRLLTMK